MSEKCRFAQLLLTEDQMRKINIRIAALPLIVLIFLSRPICLRAQVEKAAPYPAMALLDQYLIPDENAEIALARSAAPASISDAAEVMVLRRDGYATAVKGANGFLCIVERSWANPSDASDFWNPKMRAPTCAWSDVQRVDSCGSSDQDRWRTELDLDSSKPLDDLHRCTTFWAEPKITRVFAAGYVLLCLLC